MSDKNQMIIDTFHFRHACKHYDPKKKVSDKDFNTILEAARLSPSSFGYEPWKLLVLQNSEIKEKLRSVAWGAINSFNGASHFVILLSRKKTDTIFSSDYIKYIMKDIQELPSDVSDKRIIKYEKFQKYDFKLLDNNRTIFDWATKQTYIVLANMMTAAAFLGIDSCPIEGFDMDKSETILQESGILDTVHFGISVMASFGYRSAAPRPKKRQRINDIVQWI